VASIVAIAAIVALGLNWFGAHLTFFGDSVVITPEEVRAYWVILGVLCAAVIGSLVIAGARGARLAWVWHLIVTTAGVMAAVGFAVTTAGPVLPDPPPAHTRVHSPAPQCHSGGDSRGCPGG
jgi:hypothetical protein